MNKTKFILLGLLSYNLIACNSGNSSTSSSTMSSNSVPLVVSGGVNGQAFNRAFITLTVCEPGTTNCQTIDNILVDSGSTGLRINQSVLGGFTSSLPAIEYNGEDIYTCMQYAGGYAFGPAVSADVQIGSEIASDIPIQVLDNGDQSTVPRHCTQNVPYINFESQGANGIIGVNPYSNPNNNYTNGGVYTCTSSSDCVLVVDPTLIPAQLNINPVIAFPVDNNGLIFNLPTVPSATNNTVSGTLTFGLNTESNNQVPNTLTILSGNPSESFPVGYFLADSGTGGIDNTIAIFDSGTPTLAFYSSAITLCSADSGLLGLYCPSPSPYTWTSTVMDYTGANPVQLNNVLINYVSGANLNYYIVPSIGEFMNSSQDLTIYGLPYFYDNTVYIGLMGESGMQTPLGQGPVWGYVANN